MLSASDLKTVCIIIPAYNPPAQMVDAVRMLCQGRGIEQMIVVDDGSVSESQPFFNDIQNVPNVTLLRHAVNLGKGQALKTAFNHVLLHHPNAIGVVSADADGQHLPEDILSVAECLLSEPASMVLGSRCFRRGVPWQSKFGNVLTRHIFGLIARKRISDTQTGLRGIPRSLLAPFLQLRSTRYEFEMEMLITAVRRGVAIREVPITTVYLENNRHSHFNPLLDSAAIYFVLIRSCGNALARWLRAA